MRVLAQPGHQHQNAARRQDHRPPILNCEAGCIYDVAISARCSCAEPCSAILVRSRRDWESRGGVSGIG
jgi:hypothetical protein